MKVERSITITLTGAEWKLLRDLFNESFEGAFPNLRRVEEMDALTARIIDGVDDAP